MSWFFIALGAPFLWALVNISDKYLVNNYSTGHRSSGGLVLFSSLIGILVSGIIALFVKNLWGIPMLDKVLLLLYGLLTIIWFVIYLFVLEKEDISSIVPMFLTSPIFGYIFGYIFLGEKLTQNQIIGSLIIMVGALLLSFNWGEEKRKIKLKFILSMITISMIVAIGSVIFKVITIGGDFWVSSFWQYLGIGITGLIIFLFIPKIRKEFIYMNQKGGVKIFTVNIVSESVSTVANFLTNFAILLAPIATVSLVNSFQPAILLIFTIIGSKFSPKIISENLHRKILIPKILSICVIILGSIFLFI